MGTRERKERDFAARELVFLDAARAHIREHGLLNLQMARIAEDCDYATGTLYQHFASKEDLLVALMTDSIRLRVELFERAGHWASRPRDRMFAIFIADMIFVSRHPEHFRLEQFAHTQVVWGAASRARREAHILSASRLGEIVIGIVEHAVQSGDLQLHGQSVQELTTGLWSLCVGMHNLVHAEGVLEHHQVRDPYRVLARHAHYHLNGLAWQPLFNPADDRALDALIARIRNEVFHGLCSDAAAA
ncbi:MAG: TetR/AcrR family transcriptional regulator [Gammaproteobacteria bacterium]